MVALMIIVGIEEPFRLSVACLLRIPPSRFLTAAI